MTDNFYDQDEMKDIAADQPAAISHVQPENFFAETVGEPPANPGANETIVPKTTPGRSWKDDLMDGVSIDNARESARQRTIAEKTNPRMETPQEASLWGSAEHALGNQNLEAFANAMDHLGDWSGDPWWGRKAQGLRDSLKKDGSSYRPVYESYKQIGGLKDFWGYTKETVGQQIGVMAPGILGAVALGGIGATQGELVGGKLGARVGGAVGGIAGVTAGTIHLHVSDMREALQREGVKGDNLVNYTNMGAAVLMSLDAAFPAVQAMKLGGFARKQVAEKVAQKLAQNLAQGGKMRTAAEFTKQFGREIIKDAVLLEVPTELAQEAITELGVKPMAGKSITAGDVEKFATETAPEIVFRTIIGAGGMAVPGSAANTYRDIRDAKADAVIPGEKPATGSQAGEEDGAPTPAPMDGTPAAEAAASAQPTMEDPSRNPAPEPATASKGKGVLQFIRSQGGLLPEGEFHSLSVDRIPGLLNENGKSVSEMREALVDAGYLEESGPDQPDLTSHDDVYDLVSRAMAGERIVPLADQQAEEEAQAALTGDPQKMLAWAEDAIVLPAIEQYGEETGDPTLSQVYKKLEPADRIAVIERVREGEDVVNVVEEIIGSNVDVEAIQAMVTAYGPNPELIERIRALLAEQKPDLLHGFDEMLAQFPTRRARVPREPVRRPGDQPTEVVRSLGGRLKSVAGDPAAFETMLKEIETDRKILKDDAFRIASDFLGKAPKKGTKTSYFQAIRAAQTVARSPNNRSIFIREGEAALRQQMGALGEAELGDIIERRSLSRPKKGMTKDAMVEWLVKDAKDAHENRIAAAGGGTGGGGISQTRDLTQQELIRQAAAARSVEEIDAFDEQREKSRKFFTDTGNKPALEVLDKLAGAMDKLRAEIARGGPKIRDMAQEIGALGKQLNAAADTPRARILTQHASMIARQLPNEVPGQEKLAGGEGNDRLLPSEPAVAVSKSVTPAAIVSLIDGSKHADLRSHLKKQGIDVEDYARNFRLADDYPLVAANIIAEKHNATRQTQNYETFAKRFTIGAEKMAGVEAVQKAIQAASPQALDAALPKMNKRRLAEMAAKLNIKDKNPIKEIGRRFTHDLREAAKFPHIGEIGLGSPDPAADQARGEAMRNKAIGEFLAAADPNTPVPTELAAQQAAPAERDLLTELIGLANSKTPREDWARTLGVQPHQLNRAISDAVGAGILQYDKRGVARRAPGDTKLSAEGIVAEFNALLDEAMPTVDTKGGRAVPDPRAVQNWQARAKAVIAQIKSVPLAEAQKIAPKLLGRRVGKTEVSSRPKIVELVSGRLNALTDSRLKASQQSGSAAMIAPGTVAGENVMLTPEAESKVEALQRIVDDAVANILPAHMRADVKDNIEIGRLAREDELFALRSSGSDIITETEEMNDGSVVESGSAAGGEGRAPTPAGAAPRASARLSQGAEAARRRGDARLEAAGVQRIVRQESASLRSDGSVFAGRPTKGDRTPAGRDTASAQRAGKTLSFKIDGFKGRVTAEELEPNDIAAGNQGRLLYRAFAEDAARMGENDPALAEMYLIQHPDGAWEIEQVAVKEKRQGVGSKLYAAVEADLGIRMSPSGFLSPQGYAFWKKRSPESVKWHVQSPTFAGEDGNYYFSPRKIKDELDRIGSELRNVSLGLGRAANMRPALRDDLIAGYRKERGELIKLWGKLPVEARAETPNMFSLTAYHGGPYDFDRFDMSKIGTGEGAQAFGHGLYFAENEEVAKSYRTMLSSRAAKGAGHLYQVRIDVEPHQLLDWDGPLSEHEPTVQRALQGLLDDVRTQPGEWVDLGDGISSLLPRGAKDSDISLGLVEALSDGGWSVQSDSLSGTFPSLRAAKDAVEGYIRRGREVSEKRISGKDVYQRLEEKLGSAQAASDALREAGIPGIRFLDEGSRDAAEGTRNIVVFDDKYVKITHKNGKPVTTAERREVVDELFSLSGGGNAVNTPAFRNWFGDSKVVDADGAPRVVYHGTARGGFAEFDTYGSKYGLFGQGGYFTENPAVASEYTDKGIVKMRRSGQEAQTVYPVYLSIKNPIDMDAPADPEAWGRAFNEYHDADRFEGLTNEEAYREMEETLASEEIPSYEGAETMQDGLRAMGYDGITHIGGGRIDPNSVQHRVWIAFDPEQIKSATGNRGTFDPGDPRMSFSLEEKGRALGQTDPRAEAISISAQAAEAEARRSGRSTAEVAVSAARHEALEFFNAVGLIAAPEWANLQRVARAENWIGETGVRKPYTAHYGKSMGKAQLEDLLLKEAIMEKYGRYRAGNYQPPSWLGKVFKRITDFVERIISGWRKEGFQTWEDIFQKVDQGELRRRYEQIYGRTTEPNTQAMIRAGVLPDARGIAQAPGVTRPPRPSNAPQTVIQRALNRARPIRALSELMADFQRAAGLSVRTGRIDPALQRQAAAAGGQVNGMYNGVARVRVQKDFDTFAHEAGHHLERMLGNRLQMAMAANSHELLPMAGAVAGQGNAAIREGFAEFFRRYLTNEQAARQQAPSFYRAFESLVEAENPRAYWTMQDIQDEYDRFVMGDPLDRGAAQQTVIARAPGAIGRFFADAERDGFFPTMGDRLYELHNGFVQSVFDQHKGWWLAVRTLLEEINQATGQRITLAAVDNPNKLIRLTSHTRAWAAEALKEGFALRGRPNGGGVSMHQVLATAFGGTARSAWNEERMRSFGDYLIARRAVHQYVRFRPQARQTIQAFVAANPQLSFLLPRLPTNIVSEIDRPPTAEPLYEHLNRLLRHERENPQFRQAAELYYRFNKDLIQFLWEKGLITQEERNEYQRDRDYAPFQRNMSDRETAEGEGVAAKRPARGRDTINKQDVYRAFGGSMRDIINPIQSTVQTVFEAHLRGAINDTLGAMDRLARQAGNAGNTIFERLPPTEARATEVRIREQLRQAARAANMSPTDTALMLANVESQIGQNVVTTMFTQQQASERGEKIVWFFENGKPIPAQLPDGTLGRMMFESLTAVGRKNAGILMDALTWSASTVRTGTTLSPSFILRNLWNDAISAPMNSRFAWPVVTQISGLREILRGGTYHHLYNRNAGMLGGAATQAFNQQTIERDIALLRERGFQVQQFRSWGGFIRAIAKFGELGETATRVGIFKAAMRSAMRDGMSQIDAATEAAHYAHDVMDFSQHGSKTEFFKRVVAFFNAALVGMHRYGKSLTASNDYGNLIQIWNRQTQGLPLSRNEQQALGLAAKSWILSTTFLGGLSMMFYLLGADDDDMKEVPDSIRATHWRVSLNGILHLIPKDLRIFFAGEDEKTDWFGRLPKPYEIAWFANGVERMLDYTAENDPAALNGFAKDMFAILMPPTSVAGADLAYGFVMGKDMYSGNDIVPTFEKGPQEKEREAQFGPYTSWAAKQIGDATGVSPYYADFVIRSLLSSSGREGAMVAQGLSGEGPMMDIGDYPVAQRFTYNAARSSQSLSTFYNMMTQGEGLNKWFWSQFTDDARSFHSAANTYKDMLDAGGENSVIASDFLNRINPDQRVFAILSEDFGRRQSKYRNLHPMINASEGVKVTNAIMKEVVSGTLVQDKDKKFEEKKPLDREQMRFARNELGHIRKGLAQNALNIMGVDGWRDQRLMDVDARLKVLKEGAPEVYAELMRRLKKEKVQEGSHLAKVWPKVKERVEASRKDADLGDLYGPIVGE